ncbi:MAG: YbcC family protein [Candidatus Methylumidiphilus sp.]
MNQMTVMFREISSAGYCGPRGERADAPCAADSLLLADAVASACLRVPPLWPLKHFVAVNPFLGLLDRDFMDACATLRQVAGGNCLMPATFYQGQLASGRIGDADLASALAWFDGGAFASTSVAEAKAELTALAASGEDDEGAAAVWTVADTLDRQQGSRWAAFVVEEIAKWCAAYFDEGQSSWRMPWRSLPLYAAWKQAARYDRNPEMAGLKGFRQAVAALPDDPMQAIEAVMRGLSVPAPHCTDFLHRQLMTIGGWGGFVQYRVREADMKGQADDTLAQLLAIRLAFDHALRLAFDVNGVASQAAATKRHQALPWLGLFQLAYEMAGQRTLLGILAQANGGTKEASAETAPRKAVQAVFCIDVRSEVYRRALETVSAGVETVGFAGFFGFPIEYIPLGHVHGPAHCPVLLSPKHRIRESLGEVSEQALQDTLSLRWQRKRLGKLWKSFKTSAVSCFSYVEVAGLLFGVKLFTDSFGFTRTVAKPGTEGLQGRLVRRLGPTITPQPGGKAGPTGLALAEQVALARNALQGMGLTANFARLVLLCGHGSSTVNNPYGAGLDCGACGGHSGEANARVAVAVLNDPRVRAGLAEQGIHLPQDTWFLAGLHDTTTDSVRLFDVDRVPRSHAEDIQALRDWLAAASPLAREERAARLGLDGLSPAALERAVQARSRDWSQVRPEWGLAGNAAFIAAPRERTRQARLDGRVFLHNYDFRQDADGSILELIMTAPLVVASWINLQYYASTVDNRVFGSGNKTIHNVVGTVGVALGNGGDLQVGLPWQSLHDGEKLIHEPLRLSVYIEAPAAAIESVIAKHAAVRQLVDHHWLHLFRIEAGGSQYYRYLGLGRWLAETGHTPEV